MLIYIKGFRSVSEYQVEFPTEAITLLSGPSGIGKSTLMNAVYWCLFGTLKNVRKFGSKSGACMVKLDIGCIQITRSKSPESLVFKDDSITLQDKEAQIRIESLFGTPNIWLSCCYLRQGTRNKFLESSPSERLDILSELCFSSCNPEQEIEKIEEKLKEVSKEFERKNDFYKRDLELFQKKRKENPGYKSDILSQEKKNQLQNKNLSEIESRLLESQRAATIHESLSQTRKQWFLNFENYQDYLLTPEQKSEMLKQIDEGVGNDYEFEIQELETKKRLTQSYKEQLQDKEKYFEKGVNISDFLISNDKSKEIAQQIQLLPRQIEKEELKWHTSESQKFNLQNLTQQLIQYEKTFSELRSPHIIQELFENLCHRIHSIYQLMEQKKKLDAKYQYLESIQHLLNHNVDARPVEPMEIKNAIIQEKKIQERNEYLKSLNIVGDRDNLEKAISKRKSLCQVQPLLSQIEILQKLEESIQNLQNQIDGLGKKIWISEKDLPRKILEFTTAQNSLHCPKCKTNLRYENHSLTECKVQITKEKLDVMGEWIKESKQRIEWIQEQEKLSKEMDEKAEEFDFSCKEIGISQEEIYQFPKLEPEDHEKLLREISLLENYLVSIDEPFTSPEILEISKTKWEAQNIKEECRELESITNVIDGIDVLELENQKNQLTEERTKQKILFDSIKELRIKIENFEIDESLCSEEIQGLKEKLNQLRITLVNHEKAKEWLYIFEKIKDVDMTLIDNQIEICKQREERKQCMNQIQSRIHLCEKAEKIKDIDDKLSIPFESPELILKELEEEKSKIEESKQKIQKSKLAEELLEQRNQLENQRNELVILSNKVGNLSNLKLIANELEHKRMISILETINDFSNEILTILFDEPIKIEFSVYKVTKTKDKMKPSIVYKLLYKGNEIDHVDQLSGGEGDRVSLAVTCAMFQFSKFPFLLLDEFASSLDLNTKESAVKSLKTFLGIGTNQSKSILCISHDTVEGIYDHIIQCNSVKI